MSPTPEEPARAIRLAELMAALSIATDLGMGQPLEFAMQSCVVALRLGEKLRLGEQELRAVFFQSLLRYIGCNFDTRLLAAVFGDELALRKDLIHADITRADFFRQMVRALQAVNEEASSAQLLRSIAGGLIDASRFSKELYEGHCEIAERLAERLGLEKEVIAALKQVYARWDGKGTPALKGEAIAPAMLVTSLAQDAVYAFQLDGIDAALNMLRQRKGSMYAPQHVDVFCAHAAELLTVSGPSWETLLKMEPGVPRFLDEAGFDSACQAMADFTDLKSPYLLGHSPGVARMAQSAARRQGFAPADVNRLWRAALLHDIGRVGISAGIWGKQGSLSEQDWEKIRLHPYYTERILARSSILGDLGKVASMHHERMDGSGYHHGAAAPMLTAAARLLAAADVYQALTEARPQRPGISGDQACEILVKEGRAGRLDQDAVRGMISAVREAPAVRRQFPGGLSEREVEVLRLIARGHTLKVAAQALGIAPKTVDSHIQHIYNKIGVSTRAGATLFAMENNLL